MITQLPKPVHAAYAWQKPDGASLEVYSFSCNTAQTVFHVFGCKGHDRWQLKAGAWVKEQGK